MLSPGHQQEMPAPNLLALHLTLPGRRGRSRLAGYSRAAAAATITLATTRQAKPAKAKALPMGLSHESRIRNVNKLATKCSVVVAVALLCRCLNRRHGNPFCTLATLCRVACALPIGWTFYAKETKAKQKTLLEFTLHPCAARYCPPSYAPAASDNGQQTVAFLGQPIA